MSELQPKWIKQIEKILDGSRDDAAWLALAYVEGRSIEAAEGVLAAIKRRRSGRATKAQQREDLQRCVRAFLDEMNILHEHLNREA